MRPFTPPSLANLPSPPTFLLKPATRREQRLNRRLLVEQGLSRHSDQSLRDETVRALHETWSEDLVAEHEPRLRQFWAELDQHVATVRQEGRSLRDAPFKHPDSDAVALLADQIARGWPPLRRMIADNLAFDEESPALYTCCIVAGWQNVDVPFSIEAGRVPVAKMEDVEDWLRDLEEREAGRAEGIGSPGTAYAELCLECARALYLTEADAKNSASPSPTPSIPNTSNGTATADSSSKASSTPDAPQT